MKMKTWIILVIFLAACGSPADDMALPPMENVSDLPIWTAEDWVSYTDAVAILRLEGIEEMPPEPAEVESGSGLRYSELSFSVEELLWSNLQPGDPTPTVISRPQVSKIVSADGDDEGRKVKFLTRKGAEIGDRFLAAISWYDESHLGARWFWHDETILPLDGDKVQSNPRRPDIQGRLDGMTLDEVASMLANARPHPYVDQVLHLPPSQRAREVYLARTGGGLPPPLPPSTPG